MREIKSGLSSLAIALAATALPHAAAHAQTAPAVAKDLTATFDTLLASSYPADGPGVTMIVTKGGRTIYSGARGLADVTANTPLTSDSVIRLGSITKQFTAAIILQLAAEGRLSLDDTVARYYPGYPLPGGGATVRQLLNHTSGIQSYTDIPGWMTPANFGRPYSTDALVAVFRDQPAAFRPGDRWAYNNSGYILLGGIIEKVTGAPWHAAVDARIARPLGLRSIRYGNPPAAANWAVLYSRGPTGAQVAPAIDMSVPQAAGGLVGSVGDLARWAQALHHGKVVPAALYAQMIAPTRLNDGTTNPYGFGITNGSVRGFADLEHSGGIPGASTNSLYVPGEDVFVAVFANSDAPATGLDPVMRRAAALALGRPYAELRAQPFDRATIAPWLGRYAIEGGAVERQFFERGGKLYIRRGSGSPTEVRYAGDGRFMLGGGSLTWFRIVGAAGGYRMEMHQAGEDAIEGATRAGDLPAQAAAVVVPRATLERYVGRYRIRDREAVIAFGAGDSLMIQLASQPALPLEPLSETRFSAFQVGAEVTLDGRTVIIRQNGQEMVGQRVD